MAKNSAVLSVAITADTKKFKSGLDGASAQIGKFSKSVGRASKKVAKGLGIMGGAALGLGAVAGKHLFSVGEELVSLDKKISTVFSGESAATVKTWADEVAGRMGLTSTAAQGLAANAGDLLKPMGATAQEAALMSTQIVGLSGALSEWSAGQFGVEETAEILQKALLGERDSLKALGISISQAEVDQLALTLAQADGRDAITNMDKALATQQLIMDKSTDAQAAYAEGGNQLTASQNQLKATMGELEETLARKLLPAFASIAMFVMTQVVPVLEKRLPQAFAWIETHVLPVVKAIAADVVASFEQLVEWVKENWPEIQATISGVLDTIVEVVEAALLIMQVAWDVFGERLVKTLAALVGPVSVLISNIVQIIQGLIDFVFGVFTGDWQRAWDGIKAIFEGVMNGLAAIIDIAWLAVKFAVGALIDGVKLLWDWSFLSDWVDKAFDVGVEIVQAIVDGIKSAPGAIAGAITDQLPGAGAIGGAWGWVKDKVPRGATGGIVTRPTLALIGEAGPEAVVPLNRTPGSSPLPGGGGGDVNVTVNMPAGSSGEDVVAALQSYVRRRGALPLAIGSARY